MDYEQAKNILIDSVEKVDTEVVNISEAFQRVLSCDLVSSKDVPNFQKSPLDGYTFMASDTKSASELNPVTLDVIDEVPCGYVSKNKITTGKCIKIMTGAKLPDGATCVCPFEIVKVEGNKIKIFNKFEDGQNIINIGEDIKKGLAFAKKGNIVDVGVMGMMSSLNMNTVSVYKKLKIALISTGSELIETGEPYEDGKIYNSNRWTFLSALSKLPVDVSYLSIVKDDSDELTEKFLEASKNYDIIISTGGVSVGDYDLVKLALEKIGVKICVSGINIKPGMACCMGKLDKKLFLSLSGNPMSALTTFYVVCMPCIKKMMGIIDYENKFLKVRLSNSFEKTQRVDRFLRSKISIVDGEFVAKLNTGQGNIVLKSMIDCNAFVKIKSGEVAKEGDIVEAFFI